MNRKILLLALLIAAPASAQEAGGPRPDVAMGNHAVGMGTKPMTACAADTRRFCAVAPSGLVKECLVKNWDHIANDCQDALGDPGRGHGSGE